MLISQIHSAHDRFWTKVQIGSSCWFWTGAKSAGRVIYGTFLPSKDYRIYCHRFAWIEADGAYPPQGLVIGHSCDNGLCVRNDDDGFYEIDGERLPRHGHLWLGTQAQNNRDMAIKGRRYVRPVGSWSGDLNPSRLFPDRQIRGEQCHKARLSSADALAIRHWFADGNISKTELAIKYGVTDVAIHALLTGRTWNHVGGPRVIASGQVSGKRCWWAKLNYELAESIRDYHSQGISQHELSRRFDVSRPTIRAVLAMETWDKPDVILE